MYGFKPVGILILSGFFNEKNALGVIFNNMDKIFVFAISLLCAASAAFGTPPLADKFESAWKNAWEDFFSTKTNLFYDYISSYESGKQLAHLPAAEEVVRQYPNFCGYGTGMEDCAILGGAMLSALADLSAKNGAADDLKSRAKKVFEGLKLCCTAHGVKGFVARGVCIQDCKSVYINSSRDQYTHLVHGFWKYFNSNLSDPETKRQISALLSDIAERMMSTVIPENDYDSLRADGSRCGLGICRMWNVGAHEAARLPMIYAAAWKTSGNARYFNEYKKYFLPALEQSEKVTSAHPAYALLQMQCSLELLRDVQSDSPVRDRISALMRKVAELTYPKAVNFSEKMANMDLTQLGIDWRNPAFWRSQSGYNIPDWGEYRKMWDCVRGAAEGVLVCQMASCRKPECGALMEKITSMCDYDKLSSCGIIYHIAAMAKM